MSRSATIFTFADGEVHYGLHCNTSGGRIPVFFKTEEERDKYWDNYGKHDWAGDWKMCGCLGEPVTTGPQSSDESYVPTFEGLACRTHGKYFGPYSDWPECQEGY